MNKGRFYVVYLSISAAVVLAAFSQVNAQIVTAQEFSGRATGINSIITPGGGSPTTTTVGDTCPLPARGGTSTVTSPGGPLITGVLGSASITSTTSGSGITSQSSSSVNGFVLIAGGWQFRAANANSSTQCNCCDIASPGCSGQSTVTGFTLTDPSGANVPVTISGAANQSVTLPGGIGTIVFNERSAPTPNQLTVNAMHINVTVGGTNYNVVVASSHSDILCPGVVITAGEVNVSGRVVDANGNGISRATVTITNTQGQVVRSTMSSETGSYTLAQVESGQTYIVQGSHRLYSFTPRPLNLLDEVTGFNLVGMPR